MISEDSLPTKSRSLRAKSIAKRLATEKNQSDVKQGGRKSSSNFKASAKRSSSSSSKHHTMSKYRRKVANAKGQLISKCLFGVIILYTGTTEPNLSKASETSFIRSLSLALATFLRYFDMV